MPMYNFIEYSWNYSERTGSLWFYSKDEATYCNSNIKNIDNLTSSKNKAKLLGNIVTQPYPSQGNGIIKNATIAVPLEYLSNFLEIT